MDVFKIWRPGLMSTIQDLGRVGNQSSGFSPAGSVDFESALLANFLLDNPEGAAVIEMTLQGMTFEVLRKTYIATAGAPMELRINEQDFPIGRPITLKKGDLVQFGRTQTGLRTYLAVPGGFQGTEVLGSLSTHVRSGIGGYKGRALERGDLLAAKTPANANAPITSGQEKADGHYPYALKPREREVVDTIRIIKGPEYDRFSADAKEKLVTEWYTIQNQSDRMGIRLEGKSLTTGNGTHDIISAPTQLGNVQVPKNGQPIILLSDRQSSGGYTRIATVAKIDLLKLAQMQPKERFRFELIDVAEAQALYNGKMKELRNREAIALDSEFGFYRRVEAEAVSELLGG